jgi:hypothetical protein
MNHTLTRTIHSSVEPVTLIGDRSLGRFGGFGGFGQMHLLIGYTKVCTKGLIALGSVGWLLTALAALTALDFMVR